LYQIDSIPFEKFLNKTKRILFLWVGPRPPAHAHLLCGPGAPFPSTYRPQVLPGRVARQPSRPCPIGAGPPPPAKSSLGSSPSLTVPSVWCTEPGAHSLPLSFSASARSCQAHPTPPFSCEVVALHPSSSRPGTNSMHPIAGAAVHRWDFVAMPPRPP
jgi:hypothetical protein